MTARIRKNVFGIMLLFVGMLTITAAIWGAPTALIFRHIFLDVIMIAGMMKKPFSTKYKALADIIDFVFATVILGILIYILRDPTAYMARAGMPTKLDIVIGAVYLVILLELARRFAGMAMVIIAVVFFAQNCVAQYLPGFLHRANMPFKSMVDFVFMRMDGIFGMPTQVMSTYVVLFMVFAALLETSGAGTFFIDLATALTGKSQGGPAKAAVISSACFGAISGSAIANVAGTGAITIPLMKRVGYDKTFAGAVEAVSSTGGQFMPPIMGAVAFILAQNVGIKYIEVAARATLPAVLYFACVFFAVDFRAKKMNLESTPADSIPNLVATLKQGWMYTIPLVVIVWLLAVGKSAQFSALVSMLSLIIVSYFRRGKGMRGRDIVEGVVKGTNSIVGVAITAGAAGIIIGGVTNTGLNLIFANQVVKISGGNLLITLVLVAIVCVLLGMGMTTSAVYISVATIMAPALTKLGVSPFCAHMFVLYYGCLCVITPPVALAAYTAAGISGASPSKTGWTSFRVGIVAFIVPFIFVYQPVMLLYGSVFEIILCGVTSLVGCYGLAAALEGFFLRPLNVFERMILVCAAMLLMIPGWQTDIFGGAAMIAVFVYQKRKNNIRREAG